MLRENVRMLIYPTLHRVSN